MPCPENKISCGTTDPSSSVVSASPCEIKLSCSGEVVTKGEDKGKGKEKGKGKDEGKDTCEKKAEDNSDPCKKAKKCSATPVKIIEPQAELNDEPCPDLAARCQTARPDLSATTTRVDTSKQSCIDFEYCEKKPEFGCGIDYEDCKDFKEAEKQRKAMQRKREKDKAKENKK